MGLIVRQSFKASIVSYVGVVIGMVNVLFITTKVLSPEEVGLTRVLFESGLLFASLAHLGAPFIADKFFPFFQKEENKHNGFLVFLLAYSLTGYLLFSALFLLGRNVIIQYYLKNSPLLVDYIYYVLGTTFFIMYQTITEAYCRIHGRIVVPTMVRELFLKATNGILIVGYGLKWYPFETFIVLSMSSYGVAVLFNLLYIKSLGRLYLRFDFSHLNSRKLLEISGYGLFIILGGAGTILSQKIDAIMLPAMKGLDYTAIYGIAFMIAQVIEIPRRSITQITSPILSKAWKSNDLDQIESLYKKSSVNQLISGSLLFLLMWSNIDALFSILPKAEIYGQGKYVVLLIALSRLVDMASGLNGEIILYSRYYRFATLAVLILAITTIITNQVFIPIYAINGAALATAFSVFLFTIIKVVFVWFRFRLQPFAVSTLLVVLISGFVYFVAAIFPVPSNNTFFNICLGILLRSAVATGLFVSLTYVCNVSEDINKLINSIWLKGTNYIRTKFKE